MNTAFAELETKLTPEDRILLEKFVKILLKKEKYAEMRKEIEKRRKEVEKGEYLTHEEFWRDI